MTQRDRKALTAYMRLIADRLGLRDWTLNLLQEPAGEDYNAQVRIIYGRKVAADVRVSAEFRTFDPDRVQRTIVHELTHLHFAACTNQVEHDLVDYLPKQALDLFFSAWLRDFEYGIDGLATAVAPHMPLIEWPS